MLDVAPDRIVIRQGDRLPGFRLKIAAAGECCGPGETPIDPALFESWLLTAYGWTTISIALTYDAAARELVGAWGAGQTDVAGTYQAVLTATETATGLSRTFPTVGAIEVVIEPRPGP